MSLNLNRPQAKFIESSKPFRAFCGGFRSGKTFIGCVRLWTLAMQHPNMKLGYFAPTYGHVRDILYPTIGEVGELFSEQLGVPCDVKINKSEHTVGLYVNGIKYATINARSMERPETIVGFDISHALVDEIDCMKKAKADAAWKKIVARMSSVRDDYLINTVDFTTTPEGFNWIYDFFVKQLEAKPELKAFYELVKASTIENAKNLPSDYIDKLYATYPKNLVEAYVGGEFVNLTAGAVYHQYDRELNASTETLKDGEPVYIGMDFNVGQMAAVFHVKRGRATHAVGEVFGANDTPHMIKLLKDRLWSHDGRDYVKSRAIYIYPDAAGDSRKSVDASKTDIKLLEREGFRVAVDKKNPPVKDRINSVNAMFCNGDGDRRYFVNPDLCKVTVECLEQQVYNKHGEPDKSAGDDHMNDALGYYITKDYPIGGGYFKPKNMSLRR